MGFGALAGVKAPEKLDALLTLLHLGPGSADIGL
jgi:hypothetical protein